MSEPIPVLTPRRCVLVTCLKCSNQWRADYALGPHPERPWQTTWILDPEETDRCGNCGCPYIRKKRVRLDEDGKVIISIPKAKS